MFQWGVSAPSYLASRFTTSLPPNVLIEVSRGLDWSSETEDQDLAVRKTRKKVVVNRKELHSATRNTLHKHTTQCL